MANVEVQATGYYISCVPTHPASPATNNPAVFGQIPGVIMAGADAAGNFVMKRVGVFTLTVHGYNGTAGAAITAGSIIYYDNADASGPLNVNTAAVRFGYALGAVNSGAQTAISVLVGY